MLDRLGALGLGALGLGALDLRALGLRAVGLGGARHRNKSDATKRPHPSAPGEGAGRAPAIAPPFLWTPSLQGPIPTNHQGGDEAEFYALGNDQLRLEWVQKFTTQSKRRQPLYAADGTRLVTRPTWNARKVPAQVKKMAPRH